MAAMRLVKWTLSGSRCAEFLKDGPIPTIINKLCLIGAHFAIQGVVSVGKPPKSADDFAVCFGVNEIVFVTIHAGFEQSDGTILVHQTFRMHQGHVKELPFGRVDPFVPTFIDRLLCDRPCPFI